HRRFDAFFRHRPLVQGAVKTSAQLSRVECLAPAIALDDRWQLQFHRFHGGKTLATGRALAASADGRTFLRNARVDHAGIDVLAEGAVHASTVYGEFR